MKKALIITGQLVQDHELIYPYYRLKGEGFNVEIAARGKQITGIIGTKFTVDKQLEELSHDYDLLVLPGGAKCMEKLRQEKIVLDFIHEWDKNNKVICSICHGAQLLISAKVVKARKISGYYSIKDDIINAGAEYVDAPFVIDRNVISCPHYKYLGEWMNATLKEYASEKKRRKQTI